jgi:hypothetical protein
MVNVFVIGPEAVFQWAHRYEIDRVGGTTIATNGGPESLGLEVLTFNPICCSQVLHKNISRDWPCCRKLLADPELRQFSKEYQAVNPLKCDLVFDNAVPSGYGPWALSRLAIRTGAEYITTGARGSPGYAPDLVSKRKYGDANRKDPLRRAVTDVVREYHKRTNYGLIASSYVSYGPAQPRAADRLGDRCGEWLKKLTVDGENKRWQANRDLVIVQLKALRHYLAEYALAFREDLPKIQGKRFYVVKPGPARTKGELRQEALDAVKDLLAAHPNTAWAATAKMISEQLGGFVVEALDARGDPWKRGGR